MLLKLKTDAKTRYDKKRSELSGLQSRKGEKVDFNGGLMSLDQMNLDKKEEFEGDEFDPFSMGQNKKVNIKLKA
jgi:hypothetical protein